MKKRWNSLNERTRERLRDLAFISPSLIGMAVFFIVPFFVVVYYSLINNPIQKEFVFLDNFISLVKNTAFQTAAKHTAVFSAVAVPLSVVLSYLLAQMLEARIPLKSQFRSFFLSPLMVPVASVVLIWQVLFSRQGTINGLLAVFGVDKIDWLQSEYAMVVVILLFLWKNLGYFMILFMAALNNIPRELIEVAELEGAGAWLKFKHITVRYLSPTILFVTILALINSFKVFREVYLLTGDYPASLYMLQHFMNNTFKSLDFQKLSAAAIIMALVMVVIIALLFIFEDRLGKDVEG